MTNLEKKPSVKQEGNHDKSKRRNGARRYKIVQRAVTASEFKGKTNDLEGHIFDVGVANQSQLFATTIKEVAEYAGRTLKESQDICVAMKKWRM